MKKKYSTREKKEERYRMKREGENIEKESNTSVGKRGRMDG